MPNIERAMAKTVRVEGLRELQRAFAVASKEMSKDLKSALQSAGEPVRQDAQALASVRIRRMTLPWSQMRVGVARGSVYVAPVQRGARGNASRRRSNLADLLMGRAMEPALEANQDKVVAEMDDAIADMARAWGRV